MNDKKIEAFRFAWRKIKCRIWKLPARAHNIIDVCLDMRTIKFVYNEINHSNDEICHNLLHTKLNCMRSTFSENYQYLSYKYQLSDRDWYNALEHLLGKVKMKFSVLFLDSPTASNVVKLCSIRDNIVICNTINNEDTCKLINLLCTD